MTPRWRSPWIISGLCLLFVVTISVGAWSWSRGDDTAVTSASTPTEAVRSTSPSSSAPLTAPTASATDDARFLSDVAEVDPTLVTYEKQEGNVALRSLLTDGSAFCAFLNRDRNLDGAMVSVAVGARQVESRTRLPLSVTTFNAVEAVALLTLCPSLQKVVPPSDVVKIRALGASLATPSN